jgi:hypothetical protein
MAANSRNKLGAVPLVWLLLVSVVLLGSDEAPRDTADVDAVDVAAPPEVSFAEQAEAVRAGQSDTIRLVRAPVGDADLSALDGLEDSLRRINLSHTSISDAGLARIAGMHELIQLRLASDRVTDAGLEHLPDLTELRHLHLIDMPISDAGLAHLHGLGKLESLYLDGTRATEAGMERLVEALPGVHIHFDGGHHRADPEADDHGS